MADASAGELPAPFPVEHSRTTPHGLRLDIQALRGWAIILVVWHHARLPGMPGGFLGVDVFFVISGYLMTGIIARELEEQRFSLRGFYERRVRRLLPAAYATLAVTAALAPFVLDSVEYGLFVRQLAGTATFTANHVLWRQSDYFGTGADLKPLLHTWSLSVEEQYYVLLPLVLLLCPRRWRTALVIAMTLASAALCAVMLGRYPSATFYFLPTRLWELGIGSVAAMAVRREWVRPRPMPIPRALAAAVLIAVPMLADERGHPGIPALSICLATALLVLPGLDLRPSALLKPITLAGDRSYSLYLVHWPVFAFASNLWIDLQPRWLGLPLLVVCLLWMEAQYRWVEQPLRTWRVGWRHLPLLVGVPALLVGGSLAWQRLALPRADPHLADSSGLSRACDSKGDYRPLAACRTGAEPRILVWGDSFAMHLVPGVAATAPDGVIQATRTVCGPFLGVAPSDGVLRTRTWAQQCIAFNDQVLAALARMPAVDTVVLSSPLDQYLPGGGWQAVERARAAPASADAVLAGMMRTAAAVRMLGKRVVLVAPPPASGIDLARCARRRLERLPSVVARTDCTFTLAEAHAAKAGVEALLARAAAGGLPVFRMEPALCAGGRCRVVAGGIPLYRDAGHLSGYGSEWVGRRMNWGEALRRAAR